VDAARLGDVLALEAVHQAVQALAAGLLSFVHVLNPELIVIGGGVANAGDLLFEPLRAIVHERALPGFGEDLRIEPWTLGENVGILGAAEWARRRLHELSESP
jgi:glucokinase